MYRRVLLVVLAIALLLMIAYKQSWFPFASDQNDQDLSGSGPVVNELMPDNDLDEQKDQIIAGEPAEEPKLQTPEAKPEDVIEKKGNTSKEAEQPAVIDTEPEEGESGSAVEKQMQQAFDAGRGVWLLFTSHTWPACVQLEKQAGPVMLDYKDKVSLVKVDVNMAENRALSKEYSIRYIPASYFMDPEGNISFSVVGTMKAEKIKEELDKVVSE